MDEVIKLLKTPQAKTFGWLISIVTVAAIGSIVYNRYMTNRILGQQSKINKFIIKDWKKKFTPEEVKQVETEISNSDFIN